VDVLIERETDLVVLEQAAAAAVSGHGGAVLVEGEAGIGKTRLLDAAREGAAAAGARVLFATADEIEADVPLAGARALLARASRGVSPDGPASLGVVALAGGLSDAGGPG
jgi:predicted ATPase